MTNTLRGPKMVVLDDDLEGRWIEGDKLKPEEQSSVLRKFIHRFTKDHRPKWANETCGGAPYPVQFESDQDWLKHTRFLTTSKGNLDDRATRCFASPTWPDNPERRA